MKRNIVATVNLDCRLDLKTIALHARNAEYNPKVLADSRLFCYLFQMYPKLTFAAIRRCHHAYS